MDHDVVMPQLGMTMTEGSVVQWLKQRGDAVMKGEPLFIVQTDKVEMEVESTLSGTLAEVRVEAGKLVPVGTVIGVITPDGAAAGEPSHSIPQAPDPVKIGTEAVDVAAAVNAVPPSFSSRTKSGKLASPRAKALARTLGVNIGAVPDYGQRGRVVEADVRRFREEQGAMAVRRTEPAAPAPFETTPDASRAAIAARLTTSVETIPHFYLDLLADATELKKLRESVLAEIEQRAGTRLTYTDLLLKALGLAVREHPNFNAGWTGTGVKQRDRINIGFAAAANGKLLVPVLRDADKLPLAEVAKTRSQLVTRVRQGKLRAGDTEDASMSLSNLGPQGIDSFHAIVNPPESAILAVGKIAPRPVVKGESVVARQTIHLSLGVDHRLIDGAAAAAFLTTVARLLESPYRLLLD